ncbi:uncharacterized protein LOC127167585 [Labeo rohita]|uniref:uncharacterized protein LOC127167585 n=1 Tax=Labeo rohita TaxID=84645 RepID=UPI0021E2EA5B|nr:uncharacterized protein LOC127167585 [Labeo rohita]
MENYSGEAFVHHRDQVTNLIDTFSELYLDSEEEREGRDVSTEQIGELSPKNDDLPLPPPPLEFYEDELQHNNSGNEQRISSIEHRVSELVPNETLNVQLKACEDRLNYRLQRELDRLKQQCYTRVDELSQSMVDCLKSRDRQLDQQFKAIKPITSTPVCSSIATSQKLSQTPSKSASLTQDITEKVTYLSSPNPYPTVKMDLPTFSNLDSEDPIDFIDRFEEYNELRPLHHEELLAALSVSLKDTAKSWWRAERQNIRDWPSFKEKFLFSFLNEDHKEVAAQKLANCRQRVNENIRDFAFNYRAMTLKINPEMPENELVQATLRNCNPRLASLLRGTVKTVNDLVRLGTQIEKDWTESKRRWNQEKVWQRLRQKDEQLTKSAQMFMLANGQSQKTQGKVCWQCEIYGVKQEITFYVMEDENLAVPVILGVDFLKKAGVVIDFNASRVYLPDVNSSHPMCFNDVHEPASIQFYVAQGEGAMHNEEELKLIDQAVESSNASAQVKSQLKALMYNWPSVCTLKLGRTNCIRHEIKTTDELPLRKKPYRVSRAKNDFIEEQVKELLQQKIIRPSTSPWASPVVVVDKKDGGSRLCVDYRGLNAKTHLDPYPMPQITDILDSLQSAKVFSTLDLKCGYWQVEMNPASVEKTLSLQLQEYMNSCVSRLASKTQQHLSKG